MKPTFEVTKQSKKADAFAARAGRQLPVTNCHYHSIALGGFHSSRSAKLSFRSISRNYFANEARHDFVTEAVFFGAIVLTAAVPLMNGVAALAHFVRATGVL